MNKRLYILLILFISISFSWAEAIEFIFFNAQSELPIFGKDKPNDRPEEIEDMVVQYKLQINDEEVKEYLSRKGFTSVRLGEIDFKDQVKMFHNADCVLGLHGAAFANIVFCKPGTKIIEFKSLTAGPVIANLAKKNNLNYSSVEAEANYTNKYNFPTQQGHIEIPINSLKKILEKK